MDTGSIVILVFTALWLIPLLIFLARKGMSAGKDRDRRRRILETGRPATAIVLSVSEVGPYYSRVPHLSFRLRVTPPGEPPFEARARGFFHTIDFPRLQPQAQVEVRFDPADRSAVAVVGDRLV